MFQTGYQREQVVNRLRFDNLWWKTGVVDAHFREMSSRMYLSKFYEMVTSTSLRRGIILMGPRRVGKTVMVFHTIQKLIDSGVDPQKIIYVSVETPFYNRIDLEQLFLLASGAVGKTGETDGFYVFFDEVQYLKNWEVHLKSLIDTYRGSKFIASGSAAAALRMKSIESGAGRFTDFYLPPLLFCEYLQLKGLSGLVYLKQQEFDGKVQDFYDAVDIRSLNQHFIDYMNFGGYPEVVLSEQIQNNPGQFIRHDIIDKVLLRDLPSIYGISDVQELNSFFSVLAYHSGNEFSYENLSNMSGVRKDTLKRYIEYLEAAFLVNIVNKVDINARHFQRVTAFKVYLTNPSLRCALFEPLLAMDDRMGSMVETAVFAQLFPRGRFIWRYANWRDGRSHGEVDIVRLDPATQKPRWATEVKWSNRFFEHPNELKSLISFIGTNKQRGAVVTTIDRRGDVIREGYTLHFVPTALYAYNASYCTVNGADGVF